MTTNVLIAFYSTYGHIHRMALAVAEGAEGVPDTAVQLRRIAELEEARKALAGQDAYLRAQRAQADIPVVTHDDLRWADGIAWGTPTRYGNMSAQMKQFIDTTGGLWLKGELEDKAGTDGSRQPVETELTTARNLGSRLARVAGCLKHLRSSHASAP
jgi:NAD(P)H dehydrogenase (quinone)